MNQWVIHADPLVKEYFDRNPIGNSDAVSDS